MDRKAEICSALCSNKAYMIVRIMQALLAAVAFVTLSVAFRHVQVDAENTVTLGSGASTFLLLVLFSCFIYCISFGIMRSSHALSTLTPRFRFGIDIFIGLLTLLGGVTFATSDYNRNCDYFANFLHCKALNAALAMAFTLSISFFLFSFIHYYQRQAQDGTYTGDEKGRANDGPSIGIPYEEHITPAMGTNVCIATPTRNQLEEPAGYVETRV